MKCEYDNMTNTCDDEQTYSFLIILEENSTSGFSNLTYRSAEVLDAHPPTALIFCWVNPAKAPCVAPPILPECREMLLRPSLFTSAFSCPAAEPYDTGSPLIATTFPLL